MILYIFSQAIVAIPRDKYYILNDKHFPTINQPRMTKEL